MSRPVACTEAELGPIEVDAGVSPAQIGARYGAGVPLGRVGRPEEVAAVVAHLCGGEAGTIIGRVVPVAGGVP